MGLAALSPWAALLTLFFGVTSSDSAKNNWSVGPTGRTVQFPTEHFMSPLRRCQPIALGPKRSEADLLMMPALKFGNPIQIVIQMKVNDFSHRPCNLCLQEFHIYHLRPRNSQ